MTTADRGPLDEGVRLYKECAETGDAGPFRAFVDDRATPDTVRALLDFVRGERSRLVKLKTLGLSAGLGDKIGVTEEVIDCLKEKLAETQPDA